MPNPTNHVFVSYSRKDSQFVELLVAALKEHGKEVWLDRSKIRPTEEFLKAIFRAIEAADAFGFVLSPDSIVSEYCREELAHAIKHEKRLMPIVCRDVAGLAVPPELARLDYVQLAGDDFAGMVSELVEAIDTDLDWVRLHSRLEVRSVEWDISGKRRSLLLRGDDLDRAEKALAGADEQKDPPPTSLQRDFVLASRKDAIRRHRIVIGSATLALVVAFVLGIIALTQKKSATVATTQGFARRLAVKSEQVSDETAEKRQLRALLAAESLRRFPTLEGDQAIRHALDLLPHPALRSHRLGLFKLADLSPDAKLVAVYDARVARLVETLTGHETVRIPFPGEVLSIAFSPDGSSLVASGENHWIGVWDVATGALVGRIESIEPVRFLALSPDRKSVALAGAVSKSEASESGTKGTKEYISIRTLGDGQESAHIVRNDRVANAVFLPENDRIVTITTGSRFKSSTVDVWETRGGRAVKTLKRLDGSVTRSAFHPGGHGLALSLTTVLIGGGQVGKRKIVCLDLHLSSAVPDNFQIDTDADLTRITLSPNGWFIAATLADHTVGVWRWGGGLIGKRSHKAEVSALAVGAQTPALATVTKNPGGSGDDIQVGLPSETREIIIRCHAGVQNLAFSPDAATLTVFDKEGTVSVWQSTTGAELARFADEEGPRFRHDGGAVALKAEDRKVSVHFLSANRSSVSLPHEGTVNSYAFSPDGRYLVTKSSVYLHGDNSGLRAVGDNDLRIWDPSTGRLISRRPYPVEATLSPDGRLMASIVTNHKRELRLEDAVTGQTVGRLVHPVTIVAINWSIAIFSDSGSHLVTVGEDDKIRIWEVKGERLVGTLTPPAPKERPTSVGPSGLHVLFPGGAAWGLGRRIWDVVTGNEIASIPFPERSPSLRFSNDERFIATIPEDSDKVSNENNTARVRELPLGHEVASLRHNEVENRLTNVTEVALNADGSLLATGTADGFARVWDIKKKLELARMEHREPVLGVSFSPDGRLIAAQTAKPRPVEQPGTPTGGTITTWIWFWRPDDLTAEARTRADRVLTREEWSQFLPEEEYQPTPHISIAPAPPKP